MCRKGQCTRKRDYYHQYVCYHEGRVEKLTLRTNVFPSCRCQQKAGSVISEPSWQLFSCCTLHYDLVKCTHFPQPPNATAIPATVLQHFSSLSDKLATCSESRAFHGSWFCLVKLWNFLGFFFSSTVIFFDLIVQLKTAAKKKKEVSSIFS